MELRELVETCIWTLQDEANTGANDIHEALSASVNTKDGTIDLYYVGGKCEVTVCHDRGYGIESPLLTIFLSKALENCVDWDEARQYRSWSDEDVYQRNGFASEADFWRWKEGY